MKEQYERAIRRMREYEIKDSREYTELAKKINLLSIESMQYIAGENFRKILKRVREVKIKGIARKEEKMEKVNQLLRKILEEQVSKVYTPEGIERFKGLIENKEITKKLKFYGAYIGEELIGVAVTKRDGNHIVLLGVDVQYQNLGIGKRLYKEVVKNRTKDEITASSSPVGAKMCKRFGFVPVGEERQLKGMSYITMKAFIKE